MKPCDIPLDGPSALHSALSEDGGLTQHIEQCHPEAATETAVPPSYEQVAAHIAWHAAEIRECGEGCEFDPARVRPLTREEALSAVAFARMPEPRIVYATLLAYATLGATIAAKDAEIAEGERQYWELHAGLTAGAAQKSEVIIRLAERVESFEAKLREAVAVIEQLRRMAYAVRAKLDTDIFAIETYSAGAQLRIEAALQSAQEEPK